VLDFKATSLAQAVLPHAVLTLCERHFCVRNRTRTPVRSSHAADAEGPRLRAAEARRAHQRSASPAAWS